MAVETSEQRPGAQVSTLTDEGKPSTDEGASVRPAAWKRADATPWLFFVVFYAVLANVPFWYAKHFLGFYHDGWFCIEYAFIGLVALFVPRLVASLLLFLTIVADMICAVCETYFLTPMECLTNLNDLGKVDGRRLIVLLGLYLLTFVVIATPFFLPIVKARRSARVRIAGCLVAFIAICAGADLLTLVRRDGRIPNPFKLEPPIDQRKLSAFDEVRLSRRTYVRLVTLAFHDAALAKIEHSYDASTGKVASASAVALQEISAMPADEKVTAPNIVEVLLESWGLPNDPAVHDALVSFYLQPALLAKYKVLQGSVPFYGPTMGGEGRELCSSRIGFNLMNASAGSLQSCLPDKLAAEGYRNIAVHGLDGHFFKRESWWVRIGFKRVIFRDEFSNMGLPECPGAFPGICDAAITQWMTKTLQTPDTKPDFLYWMTLNSHLPVPVPSALADGAPCSIAPILKEKPAVCSWYQLVANVHRSVAQMAASNSVRPTVFIIVGDHTPPFADPVSRNAFSASRVPYVILLPKEKPPTSASGD